MVHFFCWQNVATWRPATRTREEKRVGRHQQHAIKRGGESAQEGVERWSGGVRLAKKGWRSQKSLR